MLVEINSTTPVQCLVSEWSFNLHLLYSHLDFCNLS